MLKKYLRLTIISTAQMILPITAIVLLIPYLFSQTEHLSKLQALFTNWNLLFLTVHGIFYCLLFCLWPLLVKRICHLKKISLNTVQYQQALSIRCYLLSAFILFELLMLWR